MQTGCRCPAELLHSKRPVPGTGPIYFSKTMRSFPICFVPFVTSWSTLYFDSYLSIFGLERISVN